MYYVRKTLEISACHQLYLDYESKCENLHGHNWKINVYCRAEKLDSNGMVCDFTEIKRLIHGKIDRTSTRRPRTWPSGLSTPSRTATVLMCGSRATTRPPTSRTTPHKILIDFNKLSAISSQLSAWLVLS